MQRPLALLLGLALVVTLGACDPNADDHNTERRPWPAGAQQPANPPAGAQQPAPVQADPSAHNDQPGEVDLHVSWTSENKHTPACEWSKNAPGQGHPCEGLRDAVKEGRDYIGLWEREEHGKAGDVFELSAQGWAGTKSIECAIFWKGAYHAGVTSGTRCSVVLTLN